ncbi:protein kinase [Mycobacterium sp. M1]|uniref:non-specific serine/threonine protein kinase n=1 Tax=Mycolicibacter acidiphilus TaxID=2835306 RepID=A0ABS5RHQ5_9MYCO|nr:serine/threonine-protein kinase [Mycolicibacter acidiphilus]MBS9533830.1 protein kinase [Mycolicibacter acidiphilus]
MADQDPLATQYDVVDDVVQDLVAAGLTDPEEIGRGGFGVVYRCWQQSLDRPVAVKVLTADLDDENVKRFCREQHAMGRLSGHPNIVTVLTAGQTGTGRPFIVMQYQPGGTLEALIRKDGPLDAASTLRLGIKIAGALETVHRAGILHRDVKPANILFTEYGEPALTDFGISRIAGGFETRSGLITGTPAFTAPEVLSGATPTVASDLYGLGATLFCALTGHAAFERKNGESVVAQFLRISKTPVPQVQDIAIPDALSRAIGQAMAHDPADRPASAAEFGNLLCEIERQIGAGGDAMALPGDTGGRAATRPTAPAPAPAAKFRPPRRRTQVLRPRLIKKLRAQGRRRLTLIHAPTGYGKTTLAVQWAAEIERDGTKVAWLTVDDNDNNPAWFLTNLLEAIRRVNPAVVRDLGEVLEERGENVERYVLTSLINQIAESDQPITVVVDDWHRITSPAVIDAMDFVLEYGCDNLQVIITSRTRSGLPLSRLRVCDELIEIDASALCFDVEEARSFLVDVAGLDLRNDDVTDLRNSTDGWVAGLQLASLSLRDAEHPAEVISHISGRHHAIAEFLTENVLSALDPRMLQFLLRTSIPERICGSLASALSGIAHGQAMLEEVEARDLFLRRTDENGDWFRYHHLFAEFLRRRLDRDQPELTADLHRKASDWFAERHLLVEAVDHALAAGDSARAVELIETDGRMLLAQSQVATLFGLVDKLPTAAVLSSPQLQIIVAWANIFLHRTRPAYAALKRVDEALTVRQNAGDDVTDLRVTARVVEANLHAYADQLDGIEDAARDCLDRPDAFPAFVISVAANLMTHSAIYRFDFDAAHRWQEWARPYHEQNTGPYVPTFGHARDGLAAFEQLDLDRAEQCFRTAWQVACKAGAVHSQAARLASAPLAELLYERGETDEAQRLLDESFKLGAEEGMVDWIRSRFVAGARLAVLRGDRDAAVTLLDEGADTAERLATPRLRASIENERVLLGLGTHRPTRPPIGYEQRLQSTTGLDGIAEITAQFDEDTAIRLLIAGTPAPEQAELACRWAGEWVDRLTGRGRERALLRAQRTLAVCLAAAGRADDAKRLLREILLRCAELRMVRFPVDGGPRLIGLIAEIRREQSTGGSTAGAVPPAFLDRLLDAAGVGDETPEAADYLTDCPRLTVLGSDRPQWAVADQHGHLQHRPLTGRHADILVLLSQHPEGMTSDHLAMLLDEEDLDTVTVRAEMSRLRKSIGADFLGSRPYRLLKPLTSDLGDTLAALKAGDVETAVSLYRGPLLPRSVSPGIARLRTQVSTGVRAAAISAGNLTVLRRWLDTPEGRDDREGWRILHQNSSSRPVIRAGAAGHLAGIDLDLN